MTRDTSRFAHDALDKEEREAIQRIVLRAIIAQPGSALEIATRLEMGEARVWRRCSDLKKLGVVREIGLTMNPRTNRPAHILAPTEHAEPWLSGEWKPAEVDEEGKPKRVPRRPKSLAPPAQRGLDKWMP